MKVYISFIIIILLLVGISEATPGRTNKDGCHNSKIEGYHCHGGSNYIPKKTSSFNSNMKDNNKNTYKLTNNLTTKNVTKLEYPNCNEDFDCKKGELCKHVLKHFYKQCRLRIEGNNSSNKTSLYTKDNRNEKLTFFQKILNLF